MTPHPQPLPEMGRGVDTSWHDANHDTPLSGGYSWSGLCWVSDGIDKVTVGRYDKSKKKWWIFGKCPVVKWAYADVPNAR